MTQNLTERNKQEMVEHLLALAPLEGYNLSALTSVRFLRSNRPLSRTPVLYDPGIVIVCQGSKHGYFGDKTYIYDAQHYLAVSVPVPFVMETRASEEIPLLAIYLHLDFSLAAEVLLQMETYGVANSTSAPESMVSSPLDRPLSQSVVHFLEVMRNPLDAAILGPALLREIYYRILSGAQGNTLRAALSMQGQFGKIGKALRHIHAMYASRLDLSQLAAEAGMSAPTFHSHFKAITQTSPMQYVKSTRLHQARLIMVRRGVSAAVASQEVGYESPSQFNREFKRLFGLPPAEETRRMRENFSIPPACAASDFVSSH